MTVEGANRLRRRRIKREKTEDQEHAIRGETSGVMVNRGAANQRKSNTRGTYFGRRS